jgi:hypothetical protein
MRRIGEKLALALEVCIALIAVEQRGRGRVKKASLEVSDIKPKPDVTLPSCPWRGKAGEANLVTSKTSRGNLMYTCPFS